MPDARELIRAATALPLALVRRLPGGEAVAGFVDRALAGDAEPAPERHREERTDQGFDAGTPDLSPEAAAEAALERHREPAEEAAPDTPARRAPTVEEVVGVARVDEPGHVEPEVELVAEFADPGAADPPGPELRVDEPWEGYRRLKVSEVKARLEGQPPEVLAAVELYESTHRRRQGVLSAVRALAATRA
jgi:hypothetical protein